MRSRRNLHSSSFLALVALAPILWPLHSGWNFIGGLVSFPILTTGAFPRIFGLTSVLRLAHYRLGAVVAGAAAGGAAAGLAVVLSARHLAT